MWRMQDLFPEEKHREKNKWVREYGKGCDEYEHVNCLWTSLQTYGQKDYIFTNAIFYAFTRFFVSSNSFFISPEVC